MLRMVNSGYPTPPTGTPSTTEQTSVGMASSWRCVTTSSITQASPARSGSWPPSLTRPRSDGRLTAALAKSGKLSGLTAGDRYDITTSLGDHLYGEVVAIDPPSKLLLSVDPLDHGLIEAIVPSPEYGYASLAVSLWGDQDAASLQARWEPWIKGSCRRLTAQPCCTPVPRIRSVLAEGDGEDHRRRLGVRDAHLHLDHAQILRPLQC